MGENQRINIDINTKLWKQVGIQAIKEDITKRELVEKALRKYLEKDHEKDK